MRPASIAMVLMLAACTAAGAPSTPPDGAQPVLVVSDGGGDGAGISVADALGHQATDDLVLVSGALFVDGDGIVRLCDAIAESFPPQCGGERIVVEGIDLATVDDLQEEGGVRWAEAVTLFGSVE